jgi:hypothetical protein
MGSMSILHYKQKSIFSLIDYLNVSKNFRAQLFKDIRVTTHEIRMETGQNTWFLYHVHVRTKELQMQPSFCLCSNFDIYNSNDWVFFFSSYTRAMR